MIYNMIEKDTKINELDKDLISLIDWEDVTLPEATYASGELTYGYIKAPTKEGYTLKFAVLSDFGNISNGVHLNVTVWLHGSSAVYFHVQNPYAGALTTSLIARIFYMKS